jgi:aromatic ring-opening dioxygenase LigB subunit
VIDLHAHILPGVDDGPASLEESVELARAAVDALRADGLPAVGVTFGSSGYASSTMPLDWGALIPLWFMRGPAVIVSPARDRPLEEHVRAGAAIARATSARKVAVVASADHGHAHDADGPYGFDPAAAEYDARVVDVVRANRLADLLELDPAFVAAASADSWWQMLMLHGALGDGWRAELLSYEAPTYFGMLCASFSR